MSAVRRRIPDIDLIHNSGSVLRKLYDTQFNTLQKSACVPKSQRETDWTRPCLARMNCLYVGLLGC